VCAEETPVTDNDPHLDTGYMQRGPNQDISFGGVGPLQDPINTQFVYGSQREVGNGQAQFDTGPRRPTCKAYNLPLHSQK